MFDVRAFGAAGDGVTVTTGALQRAIDACGDAGGGTVLLTAGEYVTGTLFLRSRVTVHIAADAALKGSPSIADYSDATFKNLYKQEPHMDRCLLFGSDLHEVRLEGDGVLDGQGGMENFPNRDDPEGHRPMLVRLLRCDDVVVEGLRINDPAAWTFAFLYCSRISVSRIAIRSRVNLNGDGLDFDGCSGVVVSDCEFDTSDDGICLQSSREDSPCSDVDIRRCTFTSKWAGIRIGLLSRGVISDVHVCDCSFSDIGDSGLKIQMCEGGEISKLLFERLRMTNVPRPVFLTLCQQRACVDAPDIIPPLGVLSDITIRDLCVDSGDCGVDSALIATGVPGGRIGRLRMEGLRVRTGGGADAGTRVGALVELTPEALGSWWPEYTVLGGTVPAHGLYARHVSDLSVRDAVFAVAHDDGRNPIVLEDVESLQFDGVVRGAASR